MEHICILVAIASLLYAVYVHRQNDMLDEMNSMLRKSLHMIADGKATIYKTNGLIRIEEVK